MFPPDLKTIQKKFITEAFFKKMFALDSTKCRFTIHQSFIKYIKDEYEKRKDVPAI
jgi:hypothetical protein